MPDKKEDVSKKAMVRATVSYLEAEGLPVNKSSIFRHFQLSRSQGYAALNANSDKRDDPGWEETRGRPMKIPEADQQRMERILWDPAYEEVNLNWKNLGQAAGLSVTCNMRTLHRAMGTCGYRRCMGCGRSWVSRRLKDKRVDWSKSMLAGYDNTLRWRQVRFSGELHFGFGLDGKMRLLPKPGEKYCEGCEGKEENQRVRDIRRVHCWAAIGHGFKSELVFYDDSTNPHALGALTMAEYRDKILEKHVKPWIQSQGAGSFVLEEDGEVFAHGALSKVNMAQQWKLAHGLQYHFSCGDSPDLNPLDSLLWPAHKQWTMREGSVQEWDDAELRRQIREVWSKVEQDKVDMWVDFHNKRLAQVCELDGKLVGW